MAKRILLWATLVVGVIVGGWWTWQWADDGELRILLSGELPPAPDSERYEFLVSELERWQESLGKEYKEAETASEKEAVEHDARVILELMMPEMMRCWLGTPYDFNGTAEKPGAGQVACGYFVSTVLRDTGFHVNRFKLAQQPSENILRTFLPREACVLKVGVEYPVYADWAESLDDGVYLIGLDTHVGFIVIQRGEIRFIHASGGMEHSVVEETRSKAGALRRSRWRMIGSLTRSPQAVRIWLRGEKVKVRS